MDIVFMAPTINSRTICPSLHHRYYAKRCFLALGETLAKNMILLKDEAISDIIAFFDAAGVVGRDIPAAINHLGTGKGQGATVAKEARLLKKFFLKIRD